VSGLLSAVLDADTVATASVRELELARLADHAMYEALRARPFYVLRHAEQTPDFHHR
jgi:hypothetical protein